MFLFSVIVLYRPWLVLNYVYYYSLFLLVFNIFGLSVLDDIYYVTFSRNFVTFASPFLKNKKPSFGATNFVPCSYLIHDDAENERSGYERRRRLGENIENASFDSFCFNRLMYVQKL